MDKLFLNMKALQPSELSVTIYQSTQHNDSPTLLSVPCSFGHLALSPRRASSVFRKPEALIHCMVGGIKTVEYDFGFIYSRREVMASYSLLLLMLSNPVFISFCNWFRYSLLSNSLLMRSMNFG